jgi:general secretion pathway protein J
MKTNKGFTLLEILIALAVFAVLAVITSSALFSTFNTRSKINTQADRLNQIQLGMSLLQRDLQQVIDREVRGNDMRTFPILVGLPKYLEVTRDGLINPGELQKRSTLKRLALVCGKDSLIRRSWLTLDTPNRTAYQDKVIFVNLTSCQFSYINQHLQTFKEWRENMVNQDQRPEPFPKAIQLNITFEDWGNMNLMFLIPEAVYGKS